MRPSAACPVAAVECRLICRGTPSPAPLLRPALCLDRRDDPLARPGLLCCADSALSPPATWMIGAIR